MEKYVIVTWPESQEVMEYEFFENHSYLINDKKGMEDFGFSAYFVDEDWLNRMKRLKRNEH